ncbi:hypothetical protein WMY93_031070 [Mugilogobius chulae]|uniref:Ninein-like protein n=1 Tax=Mugilogobius chulae TaxID=88201 RepID=A0AAW0MJ73_9GOBI
MRDRKEREKQQGERRTRAEEKEKQERKKKGEEKLREDREREEKERNRHSGEESQGGEREREREREGGRGRGEREREGGGEREERGREREGGGERGRGGRERGGGGEGERDRGERGGERGGGGEGERDRGGESLRGSVLHRGHSHTLCPALVSVLVCGTCIVLVSVSGTCVVFVSSLRGQKLLSFLDDGSGSTSPERIMSLWRDEGLKDSQTVLQMLDFSLDEPVSLSDLTLALDSELLVSPNSVHQAALICYRSELQHLQTAAEQAHRERDKARWDLDQAELRNFELLREMDDRQSERESKAEEKIRQVQTACRGRVSALRAQMEQEAESVLQQLERDKSALQRQVKELHLRENDLQQEVRAMREENLSLEQDLDSVKLRLSESQSCVDKLHQELERLLLDKELLVEYFDLIGRKKQNDVQNLNTSLKLTIKQNDQYSVELLFIPLSPPQHTSPPLIQATKTSPDLHTTHDHPPHSAATNYTTPSLLLDPGLNPGPDPGLSPGLDPGLDSGPSVSIQTELALEQFREKHQEEIQRLSSKLETQMNFYERSLEQMRQSMELERKDIAQAFKMEICELEDQKSELETQLKQMKENLEKSQQRQTEQRGRDQDKRLQRERAEMEQNFAKEISNLVQRLSSEKDQLEAELRLKMDQDLLLLRTQLEEVKSENGALQERLSLLQQEVTSLEEEEENGRDGTRERTDERRARTTAQRELGPPGADLVPQQQKPPAQFFKCRSELQDPRRTGECGPSAGESEAAATGGGGEQRHGAASKRGFGPNRERQTAETELMEPRETSAADGAVVGQDQGDSGLTVGVGPAEFESEASVDGRRQRATETRSRQRREQVEQLSASLSSLELEAESLRAQIQSTNQESLSHKQEVTQAQRKLQEAHNKVEELESSLRRFVTEKEEVTSSLEAELQQLRITNHQLESKVHEVQTENQQIQKLNQQHLELKSKVKHLETEKIQAQDQARALFALPIKAVLQQHYLKNMWRTVDRHKLPNAKSQNTRTVLDPTLSHVSRGPHGAVLQQLYLENSDLQVALQETEQKTQNGPEQEQVLESKVQALNRVLKQLVPTRWSESGS